MGVQPGLSEAQISVLRPVLPIAAQECGERTPGDLGRVGHRRFDMAAGQLIGTAIQQVPDNTGRLQAVPGASGVRRRHAKNVHGERADLL